MSKSSLKCDIGVAKSRASKGKERTAATKILPNSEWIALTEASKRTVRSGKKVTEMTKTTTERRQT